MRILITGATGFVGKNLMPMLWKRLPGAQLMTLNRDVEKSKKIYPYKNCRHVETYDWRSVKEFNPEMQCLIGGQKSHCAMV